MLLWTIFGVGVLTVAIIPSAWGMLSRTAATGDVQSANMAQTLWGQSQPVTPYVSNLAQSQAVSIIPGAVVPTIQSVTWDTTKWGPGLVISGFGFGNPPHAHAPALQIADNSRGWVGGTANGVAPTIQSWRNDQIVVSGWNGYGTSDLSNWNDGLGSFVFAPGDALSIQVTNPQTKQTGGSTTTYPPDAQMPTVKMNTIQTLVSGQSVTVQGKVTFNGQPLANQSVNLSATAGLFSGGDGTQVTPTEYTVSTNSDGQWSATFTAPSQSGSVTVTAMADAETATESTTVLSPFVVTLTAQSDQTDNNVTLSATVNHDLGGESTLSIINQTTGQTIASTNQGTSLTTQVTMQQQATDTFMAQVTE